MINDSYIAELRLARSFGQMASTSRRVLKNAHINGCGELDYFDVVSVAIGARDYYDDMAETVAARASRVRDRMAA